MEGRLGWVYALVDPRTSAVRYIGQSVDPVRRLRGHVATARGPLRRDANVGLVAWIRELDEKPDLRLLSEHPQGAMLDAAERNTIAELRAAGVPLLNITDGGDRVHAKRQYVRSQCATPGHEDREVARRTPEPMCFTCYKRWRQHGDEHRQHIRGGPQTECSIDGCENIHGGKIARGLCPTHYSRWQRNGDPLAEKSVHRRRSRSVSV